MFALLKIVLSTLMLIPTIFGESTQDEQIPSHLDAKFRELEIKLATLTNDNARQEHMIFELTQKEHAQDLKMIRDISQLKVSQKYEWQKRFEESIQQLTDGWINAFKSLNRSTNEKSDAVKSEMITTLQNISDRDANQMTELRRSVENLNDLVTRTARENQGRQLLQKGLIEAWINGYKPRHQNMSEIAERIKTEIISTMNNNSEYHAENMADVLQTLDNLAEQVNKTVQKYRDCKALYDSGIRLNGVYTVTPSHGIIFDVFCDMDDGGWTVIQNRFDGSVNFTRGWSDYRNGFGSLNGEYWLGLDKIYLLTNPSGRMLKLDVITDDNRKLHALYESFRIENARSDFTLRLSSYINGTISRESFDYHNNKMFSTFDHGSGCSNGRRSGGWWFSSCTRLFLNGIHGYKNGIPAIHIYHVYNSSYTYLRTTRMKLQ